MVKGPSSTNIIAANLLLSKLDNQLGILIERPSDITSLVGKRTLMKSVSTMKQVFEVDERDLEQAGAKGAKAIARDLKDQISDIRMLGRLKTGLITVKDICRLFDVRERTIHNWPLEPADTPTQKNLYRVDEVGEQLIESS